MRRARSNWLIALFVAIALLVPAILAIMPGSSDFAPSYGKGTLLGGATNSPLYDEFALTSKTSAKPHLSSIGDLNNDGFTDIVISYSDLNKVDIFFRSTDGSYLDVPSKTITLNAPATGMDVGDIDGDYLSDLVIACANDTANGKVYIYYQNDGFTTGHQYSTTTNP
jgi:hypothetical protein